MNKYTTILLTGLTLSIGCKKSEEEGPAERWQLSGTHWIYEATDIRSEIWFSAEDSGIYDIVIPGYAQTYPFYATRIDSLINFHLDADSYLVHGIGILLSDTTLAMGALVHHKE